MRGGTHKIQVRLLSILMLEKAASLDVLFQRSCWQIIFAPLLSVLAAEEERDQIRSNSGHPLLSSSANKAAPCVTLSLL